MSQRRRSSKKPDYFFAAMTFTLGLWFAVFTVVIVTRLVGPIELPQPPEIEQPIIANPFGSGQFASPNTASTTPATNTTTQDYTQIVFGLPSDIVFRAGESRARVSNIEPTEAVTSQAESSQPQLDSPDASKSSTASTDTGASVQNVNINSANVTSSIIVDVLPPVQMNIPETVLPVAAKTLSGMLVDTHEGSPQPENTSHSKDALQVDALQVDILQVEDTSQQDVAIEMLELFPSTATHLTDTSSPQRSNTQDTLPLRDNDLLADIIINSDQRAQVDLSVLGDLSANEIQINHDASVELALSNLEADTTTMLQPQIDVSEGNLADSFVAASQLETKLEEASTPDLATDMHPLVSIPIPEPSTQAVTSAQAVTFPKLGSHSQTQPTSSQDVIEAQAAVSSTLANPNETAAISTAQAQIRSTELAENTGATIGATVAEIGQSSEVLAQVEALSLQLGSTTSDSGINVFPPPLLPTELASDIPDSPPPAPSVTVSNTGQTATSNSGTTSPGTVVVTFVSDPVGAQVITEAGVLGTTPITLELPAGSELSYTLAVSEVGFGSSFRRFSSVLQATEDSTVSVWLDRIAGSPRPIEGFGTTRLVGTPAASPEAVKQLRETLQEMLARSRTEYQNALEEGQLGALEAEIEALENELARLDALAEDDH